MRVNPLLVFLFFALATVPLLGDSITIPPPVTSVTLNLVGSVLVEGDTPLGYAYDGGKIAGGGIFSWGITGLNNHPCGVAGGTAPCGSFSIFDKAANRFAFGGTLGNIVVNFQTDSLTATFAGFEDYRNGYGGYYEVQGTFYEPISPQSYGNGYFNIAGNGSINVTDEQFVPSPVPEPGTLAIVGTGLCGIVGVAWRQLKIG